MSARHISAAYNNKFSVQSNTMWKRCLCNISPLHPLMPFPQFSFSLANICRLTHSVCTHLLREGASQSSVCCSSVLFFSSLVSNVLCAYAFLGSRNNRTNNKRSSFFYSLTLSLSLFPHVCIILHYAFFPFFQCAFFFSFLCPHNGLKKKGVIYLYFS